MKESEEDRLKCVAYESTLSTTARSPFPKGEGKEEGASPQKKKANPASLRLATSPREGARVDTPSFLWKEVPRRGGGWMGKAVFPYQSLPLVEGGERSEPDRVLAV